MLNTNPSNKRKQWKYSIILPALLVFFLSFQIKTIAQIKTSAEINEAYAVEVVQFLITKNTTDQEIKTETELLKKEHGIDLKVSKIKRNSANEITAISISYKDKDGNTGQLSRKSASPIEPIVFYKELEPNGKIGFGDQQMIDFATGIAFDEAIEIDVNSETEWVSTEYENLFTEKTKEPKKKIFITTEDGKQEKKIIFIDDVEVSELEMNKLDPEAIEQVNVIKNNNGKNEIKIITKNSAGIPDDAVIIVNGEKINKTELDDINPDEIQTINIIKENDKKIIEIQKKKMDSDMLKAKAEMEKSKAEMQKAKAEMEKSKAELEKAKVEIEKAKVEIERAKAEAEKAKTK